MSAPTMAMGGDFAAAGFWSWAWAKLPRPRIRARVIGPQAVRILRNPSPSPPRCGEGRSSGTVDRIVGFSRPKPWRTVSDNRPSPLRGGDGGGVLRQAKCLPTFTMPLLSVRIAGPPVDERAAQPAGRVERVAGEKEQVGGLARFDGAMTYVQPQ